MVRTFKKLARISFFAEHNLFDFVGGGVIPRKKDRRDSRAMGLRVGPWP
jgi:hypothetical protein